jgi:Immunity protein 8
VLLLEWACRRSSCEDCRVRAQVKSLDLEPDPATLSGDPKEFSLLTRMVVGPADTVGEESFDVTVCTPQWLAECCREQGGIYNPRHHLVVTLEEFDKTRLRAWLEARVARVEATTWGEIAAQIGRLAYWEFEDFTP